MLTVKLSTSDWPPSRSLWMRANCSGWTAADATLCLLAKLHKLVASSLLLFFCYFFVFFCSCFWSKSKRYENLMDSCVKFVFKRNAPKKKGNKNQDRQQQMKRNVEYVIFRRSQNKMQGNYNPVVDRAIPCGQVYAEMAFTYIYLSKLYLNTFGCSFFYIRIKFGYYVRITRSRKFIPTLFEFNS